MMLYLAYYLPCARFSPPPWCADGIACRTHIPVVNAVS
ncbi:Hypothetical protein, putative [Bodo saltans]|uniref:Uncharacterized protein n=1 Tax=Bodo saltans TaxID=75058 RepID=A0A0S4JXL1_BODSA|nr:Hypothetical protein, putative [Bodo saltans]|eukprot:CUG93325.1 Hypothetical protein, putative [Bodo saltans]